MPFITRSDMRALGEHFGQDIVDWISGHFVPEEIFESRILIEWANSKEPGDVFDYETLEVWAEDNGFIHEDEVE